MVYQTNYVFWKQELSQSCVTCVVWYKLPYRQYYVQNNNELKHNKRAGRFGERVFTGYALLVSPKKTTLWALKLSF